MRRTALSVLVLPLVLATATARAQDTCDVTVELAASAPGIVAFGIDYSGAGGEFPGDSNLPGFGPSWGTIPLVCTALGTFNEVDLYDDNAGKLSAFLSDLDGTIAAGPLFSCVFTLSSGFPCPDASAFTATDASFPDDPFPPPFPLPAPPPLTIGVSPRTPLCGDGFQEGSEQCDDGNLDGDDCCTASCEAVAPGAGCDDHSVCTSGETCSAAGACVPATIVTCDDGIACTFDHCDATAGCVADAVPNPQCGHWNSGKLDIRDDADDTKDGLRLKLTFGQSTLGDPTASTGYAVCIFDQVAGTPSLADALAIPAGGPWKRNGTSSNFSYVDPTRSHEGVQQVRLLGKPGAKRQKFQLKAQGSNMTLPGPHDPTHYFANDPHLVVQLENTDGGCWSGYFDPAEDKVKNGGSRYQATH